MFSKISVINVKTNDEYTDTINKYTSEKGYRNVTLPKKFKLPSGGQAVQLRKGFSCAHKGKIILKTLATLGLILAKAEARKDFKMVFKKTYDVRIVCLKAQSQTDKEKTESQKESSVKINSDAPTGDTPLWAKLNFNFDPIEEYDLDGLEEVVEGLTVVQEAPDGEKTPKARLQRERSQSIGSFFKASLDEVPPSSAKKVSDPELPFDLLYGENGKTGEYGDPIHYTFSYVEKGQNVAYKMDAEMEIVTMMMFKGDDKPNNDVNKRFVTLCKKLGKKYLRTPRVKISYDKGVLSVFNDTMQPVTFQHDGKNIVLKGFQHYPIPEGRTVFWENCTERHVIIDR